MQKYCPGKLRDLAKRRAGVHRAQLPLSREIPIHVGAHLPFLAGDPDGRPSNSMEHARVRVPPDPGTQPGHVCGQSARGRRHKAKAPTGIEPV